MWADGSDRTTYPPFDDEPELGEEPEPDPPFNWGKLVKNVLVGLAVVVAVAAVAALTVATLGAGPILIGAAASGALIGGAMGVGMMAVSDIARGEVSDMSDYALTGLKDSFIGAGGSFTSIMDQVLRGEKINWKTVRWMRGFDPATLYSVINESGGTVHVSTDKILQKHFSSILDQANRKINVLTGAHGTIDGTLIPEPKLRFMNIFKRNGEL